MTRRNRERPGKWHERSLTVTAGHPLDTAHNPKVAGSNPAPATKKAQVRRHVGPGLRRSTSTRSSRASTPRRRRNDCRFRGGPRSRSTSDVRNGLSKRRFGSASGARGREYSDVMSVKRHCARRDPGLTVALRPAATANRTMTTVATASGVRRSPSMGHPHVIASAGCASCS